MLFLLTSRGLTCYLDAVTHGCNKGHCVWSVTVIQNIRAKGRNTVYSNTLHCDSFEMLLRVISSLLRQCGLSLSSYSAQLMLQMHKCKCVMMSQICMMLF